MRSAAELFGQAVRLHRQGDLPGAEALYGKVLESPAHRVGAMPYLGVVWAEEDEVERATGCFAQAVQLRPDKLWWQFRKEILWATVFQSQAEIDEYRQRLDVTLDRFGQLDVRLDWSEIAACGCVPPFNLPHQGGDNLRLKQKFAAVVGRWLGADIGQGNLGQGNLGQGNLGQGNLGQGNLGQGNLGQGNTLALFPCPHSLAILRAAGADRDRGHAGA
jgi:hypothetical protein